MVANSRFFLASLLCAFSLGCAQGGGEPGDARTNPGGLAGSLVAEVNRIYSDDVTLESCETNNKTKILEIAAELDRRNAEIVAFVRNAPVTSSMNKIVVGSMTYKTFKEKPEPPTTGWQTERSGWAELFALYDKIKGQQTDGRWARLNQDVRFLLPDDDDRLQYFSNALAGHDNARVLAPIKVAVDSCYYDTACEIPAITDEEQLRYIEAGQATRYFWNKLKRSSLTADERHAAMEKLGKYIARDLRRFEFKVNGAARIEGETLIVPLSLSSDLAEAPFYTDIIERAWSTPQLKVRVEFADVAGAYKVMLNQTPGGRSFVDREERSLNLFTNIMVTTIAHEFGHVLGFNDMYFTGWDKNTCEYVTEFDQGDIMSVSWSGRVLPRHVETLISKYGKPTSGPGLP